MIQITLVCAGGMSTSLMVNKMKEAARKKGLDVNVAAMSADEFLEDEFPTDVLLIAPQLSWREEELKEECGKRVSLIKSIDMSDYGMMNGEKVLTGVLNEFHK